MGRRHDLDEALVVQQRMICQHEDESTNMVAPHVYLTLTMDFSKQTSDLVSGTVTSQYMNQFPGTPKSTYFVYITYDLFESMKKFRTNQPSQVDSIVEKSMRS